MTAPATFPLCFPLLSTDPHDNVTILPTIKFDTLVPPRMSRSEEGIEDAGFTTDPNRGHALQGGNPCRKAETYVEPERTLPWQLESLNSVITYGNLDYIEIGEQAWP